MAADQQDLADNISGPLDLVLTSRQMRAAEQVLFDRGIDSFTLMQAAGRAVADHIQTHWPARKVTILCGPGNNGGDGFIVAELLRQSGRDVTLLTMRPVDAYRNDAAKAAAAWQGTTSGLDHAALVATLAPEHLVVDALFGIGLDRPLDGAALAAINRARQVAAPVVAIDIPSGVSADTGQVLGAAFAAKDTVTFGWPKLGHLLLPGRLHAGRLVVAPLGFDSSVGLEMQQRTGEPDIRANGLEAWLMHLPRVGALDHKYSRGHALVFGSQAMPGAGRLAARAARRIGAGMLTVAAPAVVLPLYMADQPGLIAKPATRAEDVVEILMDSRITALLVGSGMLPDDATREAVLNALASGRPAVIDGGGLTAFADRPQELFGLGRPDVVLTPHEGEFARLFPDLGPALGKTERARLAAERSRCTVLLKGADTVIAEPPPAAAGAPIRILINREASPHLATAGSGDVLAGLILGLLAQGMPAFEAAAAAVWFHSEAGFAAGPGLIAEDLPERIPEIRRLLEA
jgi:hydroxyethylthiazole kinase-like uncharacterized protein yjeF